MLQAGGDDERSCWAGCSESCWLNGVLITVLNAGAYTGPRHACLLRVVGVVTYAIVACSL